MTAINSSPADLSLLLPEITTHKLLKYPSDTQPKDVEFNNYRTSGIVVWLEVVTADSGYSFGNILLQVKSGATGWLTVVTIPGPAGPIPANSRYNWIVSASPVVSTGYNGAYQAVLGRDLRIVPAVSGSGNATWSMGVRFLPLALGASASVSGFATVAKQDEQIVLLNAAAKAAKQLVWEPFSQLSTSVLTRPSGAVTYAAGDLIANSALPGSVEPLQFNLGRCLIRSFKIVKSRATNSLACRIHLFSVAPTVVNGDDGVFSIATGIVDYLGSLTVASTQLAADGGSGFGVPDYGRSEIPIPTAGTYYGLLQAAVSYSALSSEVFIPYLEGIVLV